MNAEDKNNSENTPNKKTINIGYLFGTIMVVVYFGMAYLLLFTSIFSETFSPALRYAFGAVFMVYGIFRAYRFVKNSSYKR
ncbi:MAG: hypothetical protein RR293_06800 [Bacteroidales bacterium]